MSEVYSFSKINTFRTCANQYKAKYVDKSVKFQQTEATIWGSAVHSEAESCIKENREPTEKFSMLAPYLKRLRKPGIPLQAEVEIAITQDYKPCGFWDEDAWLRGKIDVFAKSGSKVLQPDWKTGKPRQSDVKELECFSFLTFCNHEDVETTKNVLIYLKTNETPHNIVKRSDSDRISDELHTTIEKIEFSVRSNTWDYKKIGLCRDWCDVPCKYNGRFSI